MVVFFVIVIILAALHFAIAFPREYRRRKNELSPFSIKEATDKLPMVSALLTRTVA